MSLSLQIAEHITGARFEQLSPQAVGMTKYSLLDSVGVMIGASGMGEGCPAFVDLALESSAKPEATVLGFEFRTSASLAAFANGALAHALDFEDAHDGAPVHPNAQTIPTALALAESIGGVEGKELITAIAVGCDLAARLGICLTRSLDEHGWYPPPILGAFGATAAAARLLKLDARQTLDALSLTLCQVGCSAEIKHNPDSVIRSVRDAFASQVGVVSSQLALRGVRGFDYPFEGKSGFFNNFARGHYDAERLVKDLGTVFEGENVSFKPWPACRGTHAFIDAALTLQRRHSIKARDVVSGKMIGHKVQAMLNEPQPQKRAPVVAIDAKFSLPFTVASALIHGDVTLDSYTPAALKDVSVLALAKKLSFEVSPDPTATNNATRGTLELSLADGKTHRLHVENPLGHPTRPMTEPQLLSKFSQCLKRSRKPITNARSQALAQAILDLDATKSLDAGLFSLLHG